MRKHGCMLTYLLYMVLYIAYFILVGKLLSLLPLNINSDSLLAISLFLAFVLAVITALIITFGKRIIGFLRGGKGPNK